MRRASLAPRALAEYEAAATWYAEQNPVAARRFRRAIAESVAQIQATPRRWPRGAHGARRILVSQFPYFLYYFENPDGVRIVAVVHAHRHPDAWLIPPELGTPSEE